MSLRSGQETEEGKEIDVTPRRVNNPAAIGSMKRKHDEDEPPHHHHSESQSRIGSVCFSWEEN